MASLEESIRTAREILDHALRAPNARSGPAAGGICVLTGAGVSAASGIPTFRDALTGLWSRYDPARLATPQAFRRDPALVTRWYDERRLACARCQPNAAHRAIARLQDRCRTAGVRFTLVTQNVDDLHERAGSTGVVRLHGSLFLWRCCESGEPWEPPAPPQPIPTHPPRTPRGTLARPGVVWFGETLPEECLEQAGAAAETCGVFLTVGTSGIVHPAAGLPLIAARAGARVIEVNPDETPVSPAACVRVRAPANAALPEIVGAA